MKELIIVHKDGDKEQQTMTSLELASSTGKRHDNIMRDIKTQLKEQDIEALRFEGVYTGLNNVTTKMFILDFKQTMILISGYSIQIRAMIIDRWLELENKEKEIQVELLESLEKSKWLKDSYIEQLKLEQHSKGYLEGYNEALEHNK